MRRSLSPQYAARIIIGLLLAMAALHVLILCEVVPWTVVWGGRLETVVQMRLFESIALVVTLFAGWLAAVGGGLRPTTLPTRARKPLLWAMSAYLLLNTLGNLFSHHAVERYAFTPLALLLALLYAHLARHSP